MPGIIPAKRPELTQAKAREHLTRAGCHDAVALLGIRGYYRDTMGSPGVNDRGLYDDTIAVVTPTAFAAFNANTDPSRYRKGHGISASKGMASLDTGVWPYRIGRHKMLYTALVQAGPVTVTRDGDPPYKDTGYFGINVHRGGVNGTSSLGCNTIPPAQWGAFIALVQSEMKRHNVATIPYVLIEAQG